MQEYQPEMSFDQRCTELFYSQQGALIMTNYLVQSGFARTDAVVGNTESTHKIAEVRGVHRLVVPGPSVVCRKRSTLRRMVDILRVI